jgi:predicted  nucleic acid-binding Zn-ribbon protein
MPDEEGPMTFTDDDLKRYQELVSKGHEIPAHMAVALIARLDRAETERDNLAHAVERLTRNLSDIAKRLEAAEAYIKSDPEDITGEQERLWHEWRKMTGK